MFKFKWINKLYSQLKYVSGFTQLALYLYFLMALCDFIVAIQFVKYLLKLANQKN